MDGANSDVNEAALKLYLLKLKLIITKASAPKDYTEVHQLQPVTDEKVKELQGLYDLKKIFQILNTFEPKKESRAENLSVMLHRRLYCKNISWSIPTSNAIDAIYQFVGKQQVLEVCSGTGFWAKLLCLRGIDIIATDNFSPKYDTTGLYHPIINLNAVAAVKKYTDAKVLMMSWPDYDQSYAADA